MRVTTTGRKAEAGFSLVEVIVALAIVALGLAAFSRAISGSYRAAQRTKLQEIAISHAQSHLDLLGVDEPLAGGQTAGKYSDNMPWRLTIAALTSGNRNRDDPDADPAQSRPAEQGDNARPFWVVLETFDLQGVALVKLETAKVIRVTP